MALESAAGAPILLLPAAADLRSRASFEALAEPVIGPAEDRTRWLGRLWMTAHCLLPLAVTHVTQRRGGISGRARIEPGKSIRAALTNLRAIAACELSSFHL